MTFLASYRRGLYFKYPQKIQKGVVKTNNAAAALGDCGQHVIDDDFF